MSYSLQVWLYFFIFARKVIKFNLEHIIMGPSFQGNPDKIVKAVGGALGLGAAGAAGGGISGAAITAAAVAAAPYVIAGAAVVAVGALLLRKKKK